MQPTKAHIEAGPFKFDFEGESDVVTQKIELVTPLIEKWLEKYTSSATQTPPTPHVPTVTAKPEAYRPDSPVAHPTEDGDSPKTTLDPSIEKLFKKGKVISLYTRPEADKAFLLILYGYQVLLNEKIVGAARLAKSFIDTGVTGYSRLSKIAVPLQKAGLIDISGQKKGTRYVLSNAGYAEAEKILEGLKG